MSPYPTSLPTTVPTPKPSSATDCNPLKPPCKHDFFSICYEYVDCAKEGNHDSYPTPIVDVFENNETVSTDSTESEENTEASNITSFS